MRLAGEQGQATSEYLMIVGLMTSVFIALSGVTERPFRQVMRELLQCIADGTTNQMPCDQATSVSVNSLPRPTPTVESVRGIVLRGVQSQSAPVGGASAPRPATPGGSPSTPPTTSAVADVSTVRTNVKTESFIGPDGRSHEMALICTDQLPLLKEIERADGSVFLIADIESEERPKVGGGLRVPMVQIAPGKWRVQYQIPPHFDLDGQTYCMPVSDPQGPTTRVTNARFVTEPEDLTQW